MTPRIGILKKAAILSVLLFVSQASLPQSAAPQVTASPSASKDALKVIDRFLELDLQGKQFSAEGWNEIATLFTAAAATPSFRTIIVVKDCVVGPPRRIGKQKLEVGTESITIGKIDVSPSPKQFSVYPFMPGVTYIKVQSIFHLLRTRSADWKIEGAPPAPHLMVDAAVRYMTKARDEATDPAIRKNAERTLAWLKKQG